MKDTYENSFKDLVFGKTPTQEDILDTLKIVATRLKPIEWKIIIP